MSVVRLEGVSKIYSRKVTRRFVKAYVKDRFRPAHQERFYALKQVTLELCSAWSRGCPGRTKGKSRSTAAWPRFWNSAPGSIPI
jgi:hypothetical protein